MRKSLLVEKEGFNKIIYAWETKAITATESAAYLEYANTIIHFWRPLFKYAAKVTITVFLIEAKRNALVDDIILCQMIFFSLNRKIRQSSNANVG